MSPISSGSGNSKASRNWSAGTPEVKPVDDRKVQAQETFQARKTVSKEIRKIQNRVDYLEKEIGKLEKRQAAIEKVLASPGPGDDVMELTRDSWRTSGA